MQNQSPRPGKRFVFGLLSPVIVVALAALIVGDALEIAVLVGLGLVLLVGLIAGFGSRKWAFLLGVVTSFSVLALAGVVVWWLNR